MQVENDVDAVFLRPRDGVVNVFQTILEIHAGIVVLFEDKIVHRQTDVVNAPFCHPCEIGFGDVGVPVFRTLSAVLGNPVAEIASRHITVHGVHKISPFTINLHKLKYFS